MPFTSSDFFSRKTRWVLCTTQFCTPLRLPLKPERSGIRCAAQQVFKRCEPVYSPMHKLRHWNAIEEKLDAARCGVGQSRSHLGVHGDSARAIHRAGDFVPDRLRGLLMPSRRPRHPFFRSLLTRLRDQPRSSRKPTVGARRCKPRPRGELLPLSCCHLAG
jgi:hypothetical protein